jgi:G3E family GTPase
LLIALTNGCVCCAVGDDLGTALATLHAQAQRFDQVLLEASGVADPMKLGSMAETWPGYRLRGVAVIADATRARALVRDRYVGAHVQQQLADADLLLISKLDQIDAAQGDAFRSWLASQSNAPMLPATTFKITDLIRRPPPCDADNPPHPGFETQTYRSEHAIDRAAFERWGRSLLGQAVRGKGFACFTKDQNTWLVQIVDGCLTLTPTRPRSGGCELVLIAPARVNSSLTP